VTKVTDGDTLKLTGLGSTRLIGVDTPEVYGGVECYGREASAFVKREVPPGTRVRYELGVDPRDRYDRALAYVWLPDGRFLNLMLVQHGYAQVLTIPPNVDHADRFVAAQRKARASERGLWSPAACGG
jgi:micrococcal nuclease